MLQYFLMYVDQSTFLAILLTAFLLGIRHGFDWDHIAALSSITGTAEKPRRFIHGVLYIFGHAAVIFVFGISAIMLGLLVPSWIDTLMEPLVGITLLLLGAYLLISLTNFKKEFVPMSRWMILWHLYKKVQVFFQQKFSPKSTIKSKRNKPLRLRTSFFVGLVHGIGAETPTQVLLFITLAGISGKLFALTVLVFFLLGLILSHIILCLLIVLGYTHLQKNLFVFRMIGITAGVFSILLGILFLFGQGGILPSLG